jgi:hypothetical protein
LVGTRCYFLKGNFFGGLWCAWILALVPKHPIPCHLKEGFIFVWFHVMYESSTLEIMHTPRQKEKSHPNTLALERSRHKLATE